jgi:hypothetical protein
LYGVKKSCKLSIAAASARASFDCSFLSCMIMHGRSTIRPLGAVTAFLQLHRLGLTAGLVAVKGKFMIDQQILQNEQTRDFFTLRSQMAVQFCYRER